MKIKKLILFILIAIVFTSLLGSCAKSGSNDESTDSNKTNNYNASAEIKYMSFEDAIAAATHIVKATYTGNKTDSGIFSYLIFKPLSSLKGTITEETIEVCCFNGDYTVNNSDVSFSGADYSSGYETGHEYVLILERSVLVYYDRDRYIPVSGTYIPKEIVTRSSIYGESLTDHSSVKTTEANDYEWLCSYIQETAKEHPGERDYIGTDYIRSDSIKDIAGQSPYIFKVTIKEKFADNPDANNGEYNCKINECLKGNVSDKEAKICFLNGTVEEGKEYVVLLTKYDNSVMYYITSKNSVYSAGDTQSINEINDYVKSVS